MQILCLLRIHLLLWHIHCWVLILCSLHHSCYGNNYNVISCTKQKSEGQFCGIFLKSFVNQLLFSQRKLILFLIWMNSFLMGLCDSMIHSFPSHSIKVQNSVCHIQITQSLPLHSMVTAIMVSVSSEKTLIQNSPNKIQFGNRTMLHCHQTSKLARPTFF